MGSLCRRLLTADQRRRHAFAQRLSAAPHLLFAVHPPVLVVAAAVLAASAGLAATCPYRSSFSS